VRDERRQQTEEAREARGAKEATEAREQYLRVHCKGSCADAMPNVHIIVPKRGTSINALNAL
jgi:hypothetical protein